MLDANICIYIINERPTAVLDQFKEYASKEIGISTIVYSELLYGVHKSQKVEKNLIALNSFMSVLTLCDFDEKAANQYGIMRAKLQKSGRLIGANDMLIAAHAKSLNIPLATNNTKEFSNITDLQLLNWLWNDKI